MDMKAASGKRLRVPAVYVSYDYESIFDGKEMHHVYSWNAAAKMKKMSIHEHGKQEPPEHKWLDNHSAANARKILDPLLLPLKKLYQNRPLHEIVLSVRTSC